MDGTLWRTSTRAVDALSTACLAYGIPLLVLQRTGSASQAGFVFVVEWVPRLLSLSAAAPWVDRLGARRSLVTASLLRALAALSAAIVLAQGAGWLVLALLAAAAGAVAQPSSLAADALVTSDARTRNPRSARRIQVLQAAVDQGALLLGPLLGSALVLVGQQQLLLVTAGLSLACAAVARLLPREVSLPTVRLRAPGLRSGAQVMRAHPVLIWITVAGFGMNTLAAVVEIATPIEVTQEFHRSSTASGLVWTAAALASFAAMAVLARAADRCGLFALAVVSIATSSAAALAASLVTGFWPYLLAVAAMFVAEQGVVLVLRTARTRLIPAPVYASTVSLGTALMLCPFPLAGLLVAATGRTLVPELLLGCALLVLATGAASLAGLRRHRAALLEDATPADHIATSPVPVPVLT